MGVFVVLLLVPMLMQHIVIGKHTVNVEKKKRRSLLFFFIWLTILVMFRHENIGNDTKNYVYYFERFSQMSWLDAATGTLEIGFAYVNKIVLLFTNEIRVFFIIMAVAVSLMIYPTYKRLCLDPSLTIVLFCTMSTFVMMFSGIRQMLAIGIGFLAYEFTRRKKIFPFLITVLVAIAFHTSAFMLIFMYPLYNVRITKKWLLAVVPLLALVFIFNKSIFSVLTLFLERYTKYDGSIMATGAYMMIVLFVIFAVFSFVIPEETRLDDETIGLRNFLLFSIALQMFAPLHTIAMRMNYYYIIFIPLLLPKIIQCRSERWKQVALLGRNAMVIFFFVYFFISSGGEGNLNVFPYSFFWESV